MLPQPSGQSIVECSCNGDGLTTCGDTFLFFAGDNGFKAAGGKLTTSLSTAYNEFNKINIIKMLGMGEVSVDRCQREKVTG